MRLPHFIIPVLVASALIGGYGLRLAFTQPTLYQTFGDGDEATPGARAVFVVEGVRCRGTAQFLASLYEEAPGILALEAFASEHKVVFTFDPKQTSPDRIQAIMEAPVPFKDGTSNQIFRCRSVESVQPGRRRE
jgi:hypothetical protein